MRVLLIALAICVAGIGSAMAAPRPVGYLLMCLNHPAECVSAPRVSVALTDRVRQQLTSVNLSVNRSIVPVRDGQDLWTPGATRGDCEEFALAKRHALQGVGVPWGAMSLAHVLTERGDHHVVLVIRTDEGQLVLDNLSQKILPIRATGHRLVGLLP